MSDLFASFACLDELTQVIYQSIYKFVVISSVSADAWTVHIGMSGVNGRWWQGCWNENDIYRIFGSKSSDKLLESFAEKLAEVFIEGELCITDWSPEKGADMKFTLGPTSKKPMHIPLVEMSPEAAAAYATNIFIDIALQAQSRKCRLYPSATDFSSSSVLAIKSSSSHVTKGQSPDEHMENTGVQAGSSSSGGRSKPKVETRPLSQKSERATANSVPSKPVVPATRPYKGSSLANPNKKARKYQAIEFASDEE